MGVARTTTATPEPKGKGRFSKGVEVERFEAKFWLSWDLVPQGIRGEGLSSHGENLHLPHER